MVRMFFLFSYCLFNAGLIFHHSLFTYFRSIDCGEHSSVPLPFPVLIFHHSLCIFGRSTVICLPSLFLPAFFLADSSLSDAYQLPLSSSTSWQLRFLFGAAEITGLFFFFYLVGCLSPIESVFSGQGIGIFLHPVDFIF
jgi:hypothetical protein